LIVPTISDIRPHSEYLHPVAASVRRMRGEIHSGFVPDNLKFLLLIGSPKGGVLEEHRLTNDRYRKYGGIQHR